MRAIELDLITRADATIVVSHYEYELLQGLLPQATLHEIPILRETPPPPPNTLGPLGRWLGRWRASAGASRDILFIGGYDHVPNIDAVLCFVREVWPRLQVRGFPGRFIIAGSNMPPKIKALASNKIVARGYVKDLARLFAACRISVAPLRYGGGIKGKIVTSLSYGVPVVATSVGVEGMGLRHGENVLVADTPDATAEQIVRLQSDTELWLRLSSNGYRTFQDRFSIAAGAGGVLAVMDGLVASRERVRTPAGS